MMRATAFAVCLVLLLVGVAPAADSLNVRLVGHCDTPGLAFGAAAAGSYVCVADQAAGLRVIDVSDPAYPQERGYCGTPGSALGVAVAGSYAYVADDTAGLRVVDVSDPAHPQERGYYDTPGEACGVAVAGSNVYVADHAYGLQVCQFYGGGVEESPNAEARMTSGGPTILSGASSVKRLASCVVFDAMGRRVLNPRSGVYFVRGAAQAQAQAQAVRKIVITR